MTPAQIAEARQMAGVEADEIAVRRRQCMIVIAISAAAYHAIRSMAPEDVSALTLVKLGELIAEQGWP